ncbi:hypothetical protein [Staphylococcus pasteuri]|uniref:hypothetical protein n=1 Tax=Staphylococcus pasteuri TaxID=45972 RepID=UPI000F843CD7|nr:hypothetical protein [Staphylococcus pasteuri]QQN54007.1 hypothetical protein I6I26_11770 [Staphylococcus pasteuri]RTX72860.1 hypothetical protein CD121_07510 [Staphylococcus pasteuri]
MDCNQEVIKAYHSNMPKNINSFLDGSVNLLESLEDGYWLGKGMYFWDNYGNAQYWQRKVESREIVKVILLLEKLLDLTDKNHLNKLQSAFNMLKKKGSKSIDFANLEDEYELGLVINTIFKEVKKFSDHFHVVKCHGLYKNWDEQKIITGKKIKIHEISRSNFVTSLVKTIYCVKDERAIFQKCGKGE